jgi:AraC family transcriptional regulator of adaptative response/methylated-DNA-[protein]-cysteine methyltransferase
MAKVVGLVEAPETGLDLPLDMRGTAFQHRVWQALRDWQNAKTLPFTHRAKPPSARAFAPANAASQMNRPSMSATRPRWPRLAV